MQTSKFLENLVNAKPTPFLFGALGWTIAWQIQLLMQQLIPALDYEVGVSLIFLPAGIRTLAVLIFGFRGAVGVFLGCIFSTIEYMGHLPTLDASILIIICAISAFSAYLMMQLVCWWRKIGHDLEELQFSNVLFIVFSQGLLSASLHQLVFARMDLEGAYNDPSIWDTFRLWAAMATGDIVGSMVLMLSGIALANMATRLVRASRQD
jgi:hypothetical protein